MDVVGRLDALRRRLLGARDRRLVDHVAVEHGLDSGSRSGRSATPITPTWALRRLAGRIGVVEHRGAGQGEIAAPPREFLKAEAPPLGPRRQAHLDDDLVRLERRRQRAEEEIGGADRRAFRPEPATEISASQVTAMPGISAAGSACARLPPTVPRLRIW